MNEKQIESCMRLFKSYLGESISEVNSKEVQNILIGKGAEVGLLFADVLHTIPENVFEEAKRQYGIDAQAWNQTFHKSFQTVIDRPIELLIAQQMVHYFTTYGLEALGLYDKSIVYIPHEQLEIPEITEDIPLTVITRISEEQLTEKLMTLITSGIALSKQTVEDIMNLSDFIDKEKFDEIKNREVKMALYEKYNIVPKNNIEFLRYLILKVTGSTLLIQNKDMIHTIKNLDDEKYKLAYGLINSYRSNKNGYEKLAEIFLRYKNLFLAFKRNSKEGYAPSMNKIINRISKLSKTYHKPLDINSLDRLTAIDTTYITELAKDELLKDLDNVTIFREIRILNAINYRLYGNSDSLLFKIRNGKAFIKSKEPLSESKLDAQSALYSMVYTHLINRLKPILKDKTVYIPENINYTVPTSEKQFVENIPQGSYIEVPRTSNVVVGMHWKNLDKQGYEERVDLDMHAQNKTEQIGWNSSYRTDAKDFVFSGDVTDATLPNGATELFFISRNARERNFLLTVNKFNVHGEEIPYKFVIAKCDDNEICKNYTINPNNILVQVDKLIPSDQNKVVIGLVKVLDDSIRFYFDDYTVGTSIVSSRTSTSIKAYEYAEAYTDIQLKLKPILELCGAKLLDTPSVEKLEEVVVTNDKGEQETLYKKVIVKPDFDLSLESITKESIIKMLEEVK